GPTYWIKAVTNVQQVLIQNGIEYYTNSEYWDYITVEKSSDFPRPTPIYFSVNTSEEAPIASLELRKDGDSPDQPFRLSCLLFSEAEFEQENKRLSNSLSISTYTTNLVTFIFNDNPTNGAYFKLPDGNVLGILAETNDLWSKILIANCLEVIETSILE
ncbi:MAG: hypothetical protein AAF492_27495, partial [Verrucomicrobiota bacterium]